VTGDAGSTQRFSWRLHVEAGDGDADAVDLEGAAADAPHLRHALHEAVEEAMRRFAEPGSGGDDEDGWELHAPAAPAPRATPKTKRS
jgi:hypothetical protein